MIETQEQSFSRMSKTLRGIFWVLVAILALLSYVFLVPAPPTTEKPWEIYKDSQ